MRIALIALMLMIGSQAGADASGEEILVHGKIINKGLVGEHLAKPVRGNYDAEEHVIKWYHVIHDEKFYNCWVWDYIPSGGTTIQCGGVSATQE
tara:strand:- start:383 stop:664 length:282 start_codon:yes stop_codon:yes gene_type:complete